MQIDDGNYRSLASAESVEARERILFARIADLEADAARWRTLRELSQSAVSVLVFINDAALNYSTPEPGEAVRIIVYPDTPVGSVDYSGDTLDDAIDAARGAK